MDDTPYLDHAVPILDGEPTITDDQRADLHDIFHNTKDANELAQHLLPLAVPDDFKRRLYRAKQQAVPPVKDSLDKTTAAIQHMAGLDPEVLNVAESHPNVLKALTAALAGGDKAAGKAVGAGEGASKGKQAAGGDQAAKPALAPRADGSQHLPPIPEGHFRVLASDGGIHDIPTESIQQAQQVDPNLHVLNP